MNGLRTATWSVVAALALTMTAACGDGGKPQAAAGPDGRSGGASVRPSGVYTVTTTLTDIRRAGAARGEEMPENYGTWVYVFNGDRLAYSQENEDSCTWAYGAVRFHGRQLTWEVLKGGFTRSPNQAYNKPGELFSFNMSMYRDTLTMSEAPGSISPAPFFAKPWHRISTVPSDKHFSRNCPPPKDWTTAGKGA
ncbi:hypothetical protein BX281_0271 [Streptomyces sp. Ag82_O1-15]|uniref:hypothetical protein n=1 Tax=Streptomyces sp. Ag82_O1-15 TaxID=1938855 RepID=UPI000BD85390|nr:hypothetical protein [Streptomyces sp. Ag82_O1-15]PBC92593.1 hypothetical protein BX281_0271 [Streptomyces sp. Ag82_O1-15]